MRAHNLLGLSFGAEVARAASLLSKAGDLAFIPSWDIQSSAKVGNDLHALSSVGVDTSSWHHINSSRCTLMGCLIQAGVYHEDELFYSDNIRKFDTSQFRVPWVYRQEFDLDPQPGRHYLLQTHGITPKADIYINGKQVANNVTQAGAYAGYEYDITEAVEKKNALVVGVYPTDYNYDLALGFVDWNPSPPDNGTGVWRNIDVKQTGPVALEPLRVMTETNLPKDSTTANVTLKTVAQNLETHEVTVELKGEVTSKCGQSYTWNQTVTLGALESKEVVLKKTLKNPRIWWPRKWGKQPMYTAKVSVSANIEVSDEVHDKFGIRQITGVVNSHDDILFTVNGLPFQVIGGGYSADMFLRWDEEKFIQQAQLTLDLGGNTIRLEGKNEHPELYQIADRMGLMVLAGWECCDKWEAWTYNEDLVVNSPWTEKDYVIANASMKHEALMQQNHPSMLGFLVGSDFWPNDRATAIYANAVKASGWDIPLVASAAKKGYPKLLGSSGMKMDGPYDWIPPNYWYDTEPYEERLGAAFGFGSELGAGVGTPEISSLKKFLSKEDLDDLWTKPEKGLYHMSTNVSLFYDRKIYNEALFERWGEPESLDDYLLKAQIMDYEATRSQFEGVSAFWNKKRPATGLIYWMLNNAWPSLHWNLFDYYLRPAGSYFGAKVGARLEHVAYDYVKKHVYLINHSIDKKGPRTISVDVINTSGKKLYKTKKTVDTEPNQSRKVLDLSTALNSTSNVVFLRLNLEDNKNATLSRNVYWLAKELDVMEWDDSDWYFTPVTDYADYTALNKLESADVSVSIRAPKYPAAAMSKGETTVILENKSAVPAFFVSLNLVDEAGKDVLPVFWSDNYVTLWPHEKLELNVRGKGAAAVHVSGKNVESAKVSI
ncbi:family 2 glycoside hydrolase [Astrocystis sublimbata]|nr:family 2 glycoside hydrolase [Astrocystis sublimbata]